MRLVLPPGVLQVPLAMLLEAEPRLRGLLACTPLPAPAAARSLGAAWLLSMVLVSYKLCLQQVDRVKRQS